MRPIVVLVGLLLMNALVLPPLLRWVGRSADWLRDPERRGRVAVRFALDELAEALMTWRLPDRRNEVRELLAALGVTAALLVADALTVRSELADALAR